MVSADEALAWLEEDAVIHDEWAAFLRSTPDFDSTDVGNVAHHEKWAHRYREIAGLIRSLLSCQLSVTDD